MEVNLRYFCAFILFFLAFVAPGKELSLDELRAEIIRISEIQDSFAQSSALKFLVSSFSNRTTPNVSSEWSVEVATSPIDDSKTVVMALDAESPISAWPNEVATPVLILRFKEGELDSYFSLGVTPNVESGDTRTLTLRFDSSPAKNYEGSISTNNKALFLRDTRVLLREISSADKLTLRFTPFNSSPVTTTFNLKGFDGAASELLAAAKIDLSNRNLLFEDEYRKSLSKLSRYSTFGISVKGNVVTIKAEGSRWKPFARKSSAIDLISSALEAFKGLPSDMKHRLVVNINGSNITTRKTSDGGLPFTSQELQELFNDAVDKSAFDRSLISGISLNIVEPTYYGQDAPEILVGKLKDTNESIKITVEL